MNLQNQAVTVAKPTNVRLSINNQQDATS